MKSFKRFPFLFSSFITASALLFATSTQADLDLSLPDYNLPDFGASSSGAIGTAKEKRLGLQMLRKIRSSANIIEDPEISAWIRSLGNRLTASAPNSGNPFYFLIDNDRTVNAFATLGGVIAINSGLILEADSESELAAVVAHEIAHITQHHISRMVEKSRSDMIGTGAAILAGILASSKSADAGQAIITGAVAIRAHKQLAFSRQAESEADRVGLRILARSGYDPKAMPLFLQKLETEFATGEHRNNEYLRSHPLTVGRVSDARTSAAKLGKGKVNSQTFLYMREKIRVLTRAIGKHAQVPKNLPANIRRYVQALKLNQQGNSQAVLKLLGTNSKSKPEALLIADALLDQGKYQQVVQLINPLTQVYPGEDSLIIPLSNAYLGLGQIARAWQTIYRVSSSEQSSLQLFETRQRIAHQNQMIGSAYMAVAERNLRLGEYKQAISQLRQAIKSTDVSPAELQKLQLLLNQASNDKKLANERF